MDSNSATSVPVAIVGIGCLFPGAPNARAYWANILNRVDAISDVPADRWDPADYYAADADAADRTYAHRGGFLDPVEFAPLEFGITPHSLEATDSGQLLGLLAARAALEDAGYGADRDFDRSRVSVILGVTGVQQLAIPLGARLGHPVWRRALRDAGVAEPIADDVVRRISEAYVGWQEDSFPGLLGSVTAGRIANRLDLHGTNCVVDAACASSLGAVHLALLELASGRCDAVLTGGIDTFNDIFMYLCFSKTTALSPSGNARPFDAGADGTVLGEGLGCMVLKRLADAERDGDRIYAVIRAVGSASDGKGQAIYAPSAAGQAQALQRTYELAGFGPNTVQLVEAHGTGTKAGDAAEVAALSEVFRAARTEGTWCALGSVKSQIGHTKAAAGAAGLIKAALALHHKVLPPTIKVEQPIESLSGGRSPFYLNVNKRPWLPANDQPRRAAVSAFGFGGSNFHCVLEEYRPEKPGIDWDSQVQIVALSAADHAELQARVTDWRHERPWEELRAAAQASRAAFDASARVRLVFTVQMSQNLGRLNAQIQARLADDWKSNFWSLPEGVYFGNGDRPGKLAVLFPGQGSQYPGMLNDLACRFPQMLTSLSKANAAFAARENACPPLLSDLIFPPSAFTAAERQTHAERLTDTAVAQPAVGTVSLGVWRILESFGVQPDAAAGHSFGELTALCAAGRMSDTAFIRLAVQRGQLMSAAAGGNGGMLAVSLSAPDASSFIEQERLQLVVANRNAPKQAVLSGALAEIERATALLKKRGVAATQLAVGAAFHSPLVAVVEEQFRAAIPALAPAAIPVFANATAQPYPQDADAARHLLARQAVQPVLFQETIDNLYALGCRTFVEVGPGHTLSGLVRAILQGRPHHVVAVDSSTGKSAGMLNLARTLALLGALGYPIRLGNWDNAPTGSAGNKSASSWTVPLSGANYRSRPPENALTASEPARPLRGRCASNGFAALSADNGRPNYVASSPVSATPIATMNKHEITNDSPQVSAAPELLPPSHGFLQQSLMVLQKLSEQTAQLHGQFLENQNRAVQVFQEMVRQQQLTVAAPSANGKLGGHPTPLPPAIEIRPSQAPSPRVPLTPRPESRQVNDPPAPGHRPATVSVVPAGPAEPELKLTLIKVVAEKTGYPEDMLALEMELDADLGIDSIKRVEIFSALQERLPQAPSVGTEDMPALRTLADVLAFLQRGDAGPQKKNDSPRPDESGAPRVAAVLPHARQIPDSPSLRRWTLRARLLSDSRRTRRSLPAGATIWVIGESEPLAERLCERLHLLGHAPHLFTLDHALATGPTNLSAIVLLPPTQGTDDTILRRTLQLLQHTGPRLRQQSAHGGVSLLAVSRLDGSFGFAADSVLTDPLSGGLAGLVKTASREWPEVCCKVVDLAPSLDADEVAATLTAELETGGPVEIGITADGLVELWLEEITESSKRSNCIQPGDLILISGGARGITAAAALAIAERFSPKLVLLGRSPTPVPESADLAALHEPSQIKQRLLQREGGKLSPRELEGLYRQLLTGREIAANIRAIAATGATVLYRQVDVRDAKAVRRIVDDIRRELGPVRGLIHGAGVIADRRIEDKTPEQFRVVYDTKIAGLRNLLSALEGDPLRTLVLFSSSTARFGRVGQADYAMANEVLNKLAQVEARRRPTCRVLSLNWGPWAGGMVTDGLRDVFASEGIDLIAPSAGADLLADVLSSSSEPVEQVVMAGTVPQSSVDPTAGSVLSFSAPLTLAFGREVNLETCPILRSHVIGGRAVVPLVLHLEWMAHGALHANPGLQFHGVDGLRVFKGIKLDAEQTCNLQVLTGKTSREDGVFQVPVEIRAERGDGSPVVHSRALIVLTTTVPTAPEPRAITTGSPYAQSTSTIYRDFLFHGPDLHGIRQVESIGPDYISGHFASAAPPVRWLQRPLRGTWLAEPLMLDAGFQLMVLWCWECHGMPLLPTALGSYRQYCRSFPPNGGRILAQITRQAGASILADLDFLDTKGRLLARLTEGEFIRDAALKESFRQPLLTLEPSC